MTDNNEDPNNEKHRDRFSKARKKEEEKRRRREESEEHDYEE